MSDTEPTPKAHCAVHPGMPSAGTCSHCGSFGCIECLGTLQGNLVCRVCVQEGRVQVGLSPFDRREELGLVTAAWKTLVEVGLRPTRFFAELSPQGRLGSAVGFLLLISVPAGMISNATGYGMLVLMQDWLEGLIRNVYGPAGNPLSDEMVKSISPNLLASVLQGFLHPLICLIGALLLGLLAHGALLLLGGGSQRLEATLKVSIYAYAINFWVVIPLVGGFSWLWGLVAMGIGLSAIHGDSGWKATLAIILPPLFCCCSGVLLALAAGFLGAAASL